MSSQFYRTPHGRLFHAGKIAIVMVGLPARGKTETAQKLSRYLRWLGVKTSLFSVGEYRRKMFGAQKTHDFFNPDNEEAARNRQKMGEVAFADLLESFETNQIGIFDAANVSNARRKEMLKILKEKGIQCLFIEMIATDPVLIQNTIDEVFRTSPDYVGVPHEQAKADFYYRIAHFEQNYETLSEKDSGLSYMKVINANEKFVANNWKGYIQSRISYFLMNQHLQFRKVYFCADDCFSDEKTYKQGMEASLNEVGHSFKDKLYEFMKQKCDLEKLRVWTSTNKRSIELASKFPFVKDWTALGDMNPGVVDGMSREELEKKFPKELINHEKDEYNHRYPRGESYNDMGVRLEPVILELERSENDLLILAHEKVIACLMVYMRDLEPKAVLTLKIPMGTIYQLTPRAYGCDMREKNIL